ncbi:MAG: hypothetical protein WDM76_06525, partial [Limisphaerales bacterium]
MLWTGFLACVLFLFGCGRGEAQESVYSGAFVSGAGDPSGANAWTKINAYEDLTKGLSIVNWFAPWASGSTNTLPNTAFPAAAMTSIRNHGSIPLFTWQPDHFRQQHD